MAGKYGKAGSLLLSSACNAVLRLTASFQRGPRFARTDAGRTALGKIGNTSAIHASVRGVVRRLWRTVTAQRPVVPSSVVIANVSPTDVYNLTLAAHNAYYANGLLVFNSADALMLTLAQQGMMVTSSNQSWLFDTTPVMDAIPGMEM
jgi:hypothetical protein